MQKFYNIEDINFIYHGDWTDPEIEYKGNLINYYNIEDSLYLVFKEENKDDKEFSNWVYNNKELVYEFINGFLESGKEL